MANPSDAKPPAKPVAQSTNAPNPTLVELRSLRRELGEVREEIVKVRTELNQKLDSKIPNLVDQIAFGILKAGLYMALIYAALFLVISVVAALFS